jgi:AraC family transcriptional activator of pobA
MALSHYSVFSDSQFSFLEKLDQLIQKNISYNHDVAFYAFQLKLHPDSLSRKLRSYLGISAKKYLNKKLLERILAYKTTGISLSEVAKKLGFSDSSYLSRFIKREAKKGWKKL